MKIAKLLLIGFFPLTLTSCSNTPSTIKFLTNLPVGVDYNYIELSTSKSVNYQNSVTLGKNEFWDLIADQFFDVKGYSYINGVTNIWTNYHASNIVIGDYDYLLNSCVYKNDYVYINLSLPNESRWENGGIYNILFSIKKI